LRKLILIPAFAVLVALGSITMADAHSRPVRFDPTPGQILTAAPAEVTGWFTSDIRATDQSFLKVMDSDGNDVTTGDAALSTDRRQMTATLQSGLGDGKYLVYWSTFDDADGEVFSGCQNFFVGQQAADDAIANGEALDGGGDCPANVEEAEVDPATAASIEISIPDVVHGDSATLNITPTNFTPRPPDGTTVDPHFGHYHIYLDKVPVDVLTGTHSHSDTAMDSTGATGSTGSMDMSGSSGSSAETNNPGGLVENPVMTVDNSYTFTHLETGYHTVSVVLNYDNHTPFNPPVIESKTFRVENGSSDSSGGIPVWALALGVIGGLVVGGVGMKLVGSRA
jgi:methionine-rich copper-binding protein CopC